MDQDEQSRQKEVACDLAEQARETAAAGGVDGEAFAELKDAVSDASPDERSAAAKELVDEDEAAYETLHRALQELDIQP